MNVTQFVEQQQQKTQKFCITEYASTYLKYLDR